MDQNPKKMDFFPMICEPDPNFSSSPILLWSKTRKNQTSSPQKYEPYPNFRNHGKILFHTFMEQNLKKSDFFPTNYEPNSNFSNHSQILFHKTPKKLDFSPTICEPDPNFSILHRGGGASSKLDVQNLQLT